MQLFTQTAADADLGLAPQVSVAEANHRITNNLTMIASLVRLQAEDLARNRGALEPEEAWIVLQEVAARIDTVGRLHRLLSHRPRFTGAEVGDYLREIALSVILTLTGSRPAPRFSADVRGSALTPAQALSVGLIVGELVTNSIKYAHPAGVPGEISLRCERTSWGASLIEIADDGVGLPQGLDPMTGGGLGLHLVRSLADKLDADLTFEQSDLGLVTRLLVPAG
jgi:two-component sensor histidine kinase